VRSTLQDFDINFDRASILELGKGAEIANPKLYIDSIKAPLLEIRLWCMIKWERAANG